MFSGDCEADNVAFLRARLCTSLLARIIGVALFISPDAQSSDSSLVYS